MDRHRGASRDDSRCSGSPIFTPVERSKEPMLFGLKPGLKGFEEMRGGLKAEEHFLEPGELGLEGDEQVLKGEELFFEQPEHGLQEM